MKDKTTDRPRVLFLTYLLMSITFISFLLLVIFIFFSTPWGLGLSPDSISYVTAARGLAEHGDFMGLPSHWPPLYPVSLAVSHSLMGDPVLGSRVLHTLLFALNSMLVLLLFRDQGKKNLLFFIFPFLIILQPDFVAVHLYLWSEPLFIFLVLTNLLILKKMATQEEVSSKYLIFLALIAGLTTMARYASLFLILVNIIAILVFVRLPASSNPPAWAFTAGKWNLPDWISCDALHRIWIASIVTLISLLPMVFWSLFNILRGSKPANRDIVWHMPGQQHLSQANATLADWFHVPQNYGWLVILLLVISLIWAFSYGTRARKSGNTLSRPLIPLYGLFIVAYIVFLLASISLADYHTPLDGRILVPVFPVVIVLLSEIISIVPGKHVSLLLLVAIMSLLAMNVSKSVELMVTSKKNGLGFASRNIREMQIIQTVRKLPSKWEVFTNSPEVFSLYLPQGSTMFPRKKHPGTQLDNEQYTAQMEEMRKTADALVFFTGMNYRYYLPGASELNVQPGFRLVYSQTDGAIWVRDGNNREK